MIRVLVAEDSPTARELLVAILSSDPEIQIVGQAVTGEQALEMTRRRRPDVVTMDINMPHMDGLEAIRRIMIEAPTPIVIVSGSRYIREVEISLNALRAGALTLVAKPVGPWSPEYLEESGRLINTVKAMAQVKVIRHWPARPGPAQPANGRSIRRPEQRLSILTIAASTGGPAALSRLLSELPGDFPAPILVVQHMSNGFIEGFASWLADATALKVKLAENGEELRPAVVYVSPDNWHLGLSNRSTVLLSAAPPVGGFRPAGSFLFESAAQVFGAATVALILTGMGQDGTGGLRAVREAGGYVIAQDEASSVVFGMPAAAIAAGVVDSVLPLSTMSFRLKQLFLKDGSP